MDLNQQLNELKYDYMRIQNDLEKRESTGHSTEMLERQLVQIESEIKKVREKMDED